MSLSSSCIRSMLYTTLLGQSALADQCSGSRPQISITILYSFCILDISTSSTHRICTVFAAEDRLKTASSNQARFKLHRNENCIQVGWLTAIPHHPFECCRSVDLHCSTITLCCLKLSLAPVNYLIALFLHANIGPVSLKGTEVIYTS